MKKIVALVLCFVMAAGLMTGCQKPMDVETLTQKMDEATKAINAQSMDVEVDLEMELGASGVTLSVKMGADATSKSQKEPNQSYMDLKMVMELMGEKQEVSMETYSALEGDTMVTYGYDSTTDMWTKSEQPDYAATVEKLQNVSVSFSELPKEKLILAEEKELVGERECYVLTADLDGTHLSEVMGSLMEADAFDMDALGDDADALVEAMKNADWSAVNLHTVYYVDAQTFLPLQYTGEVTGVGEVMNGLFANLMEMLGGGMPEGVEFEIEVPVFTFTCSNITCEGVEVPTAPQEAIDNAVTQEELDALMQEQQLPGGGTYELTAGADTVTVVLPETYSVYEEASDYVGAMTADYTADVTYALITKLASEEELVSELMEEVDWAKEDGWYLSHTEPADYQGFRCMTINFNDDTATYYYWKELNESLFFINLYTEGNDVDVDELLNAVQIP